MAAGVPKSKVSFVWYALAGALPGGVVIALTLSVEPFRRARMDFGAFVVSLMTGEPPAAVGISAASAASSVIVFVVFSVPWMIYLVRLHVRRGRHAEGRCIACGFDLSKTEGGLDARCPECGTVPREAMRRL